MHPFDPYYIGIIIFGAISLSFTFGNIENAKMMQTFCSAARVVVIGLMYGGIIYYMFDSKSRSGNIYEP